MLDIEDTALRVADPEASARFYAGLLRRRPLEANADHAVFVLAPGRTLSLWRRLDAGRMAPVETQEVDFRMAGPAAVDEAHIDWWDRGARIVLPPMNMGCERSFVARDPDGNRLRVYAHAA